MANTAAIIPAMHNDGIPEADNLFRGKTVHDSERSPSVKPRGRPRKRPVSLSNRYAAMNGSVPSSPAIDEKHSYATKEVNSIDFDVNRPRSARRPKPNKVYADFIVGRRKHKSHSRNVDGTQGDRPSINDENANNVKLDIPLLNGNGKNCSPLKSKALFNGKQEKRSLQVNGENSVLCDTCSIYNCSLNHSKSPKLNTSFGLRTRSSDGRKENSSSGMTNGETKVIKVADVILKSPVKTPSKPSSPKKQHGRVRGSLSLSSDVETSPVSKAKSPNKLSSYNHHPEGARKPELVEEKERSETASLKNVETPDSSSGDLSVQKAVEESEKSMVEYLVGDLLWSKISGHPYWPCMVSYDPVEGIYKRVTRAGRKKQCTLYHVQYFGDEAVHGWTMPSKILPFEGLEKYESMVKGAEEKAEKLKTSQRKKVLAQYIVTVSRRKVWEVAVKEAEDALSMNRAARKQSLTFEYNAEEKNSGQDPPSLTPKFPTKKTAGKTVKGKRSISPSSSMKTMKFKKLRTGGGDSPVTPTKPKSVESQTPESPLGNDKSPTSASLNKGQKPTDKQPVMSSSVNKKSLTKQNSKGSFSVFLSKHMYSAQREYPDLDEEGLKAHLRIQWQIMADPQRSRYVNLWGKGSDEEDNEVEVIEVKVHPNHQNRNETTDGAPTEHAASETSSVEEIESLSTPSRVERVCPICEKTGANVNCCGPCVQSFHLDCLGLMKASQFFRCDECTSGKPSCFSCKSNEGQVKRCTVMACGKSYHIECLRKYPLTVKQDGRSLTCPLHACLSCYIDNPKHPRQSKSRLLKCIRCPTAFHMGESCVSAGSVSVSQSHIICANHFECDPSRQHQSHLNVTWCFICSSGGSLILCDSCPAAFHAECLEIDPPAPEESFFCEDCTLGKHPRFRDVVWVKLGCYRFLKMPAKVAERNASKNGSVTEIKATQNFNHLKDFRCMKSPRCFCRWWPAEVCNLRNTPSNILNMKHSVGEFPVCFFGSHDYYWVNRGRVFLFSEGDKGAKDSLPNRSLSKRFQKALEEANKGFKEWTAAKKAKLDQENERCLKPPPFKQIKNNKPVGNVQIHAIDPQLLNRCECDPKSENPCGPDADCLNRMMMVECHPSACRAGEKCENQRFQKRQYILAVPNKSEGRGWGLKTLENIRKGQFVYEYVGDLIDEKECQTRLKKMHEENETNFYFLTIDNNRIIDAGPKGNNSRFMNHCCQPNCETQKWLVNGDTRVGLFALQDIPAGTELTFNYNLDCRGNEKTKCACGAANCSGYIGLRPKAITNEDQDKKGKEAALRKKKKKVHLLPKHEDECFRCEEGGELVMCDRKGCPKSYHLNCLELAKPPYGRWECPWHHCDTCGRPSIYMCSLCPNSFCRDHITYSNIFATGGELLVCDEHTESELENCTPLLNSIKTEDISVLD